MTMFGQNEYFYVVLRCGKSETMEQFFKISIPCIDDHQFKVEKSKTCGRIVRCTFTDCPSAFALFLPIHKRMKAILSCGKHCTTMPIGTVSRL